MKIWPHTRHSLGTVNVSIFVSLFHRRRAISHCSSNHAHLCHLDQPHVDRVTAVTSVLRIIITIVQITVPPVHFADLCRSTFHSRPEYVPALTVVRRVRYEVRMNLIKLRAATTTTLPFAPLKAPNYYHLVHFCKECDVERTIGRCLQLTSLLTVNLRPHAMSCRTC